MTCVYIRPYIYTYIHIHTLSINTYETVNAIVLSKICIHKNFDLNYLEKKKSHFPNSISAIYSVKIY